MSEAPAPTPRPAATVVLVRRPRPERVELFLVQRHQGIGFMGGMHVFPGGKVADADHELAAQSFWLPEDAARPGPRGRHDLWGGAVGPRAAVAFALAAVRETFEEAGVLLAETQASLTQLARLRERLLDGADFAALLREAGARIDLSGLYPLARWITPASEPVRFDTAFYLAELPAGQSALHDGAETVSSCWMTPTAALEAAREGHIRLAPPTLQTIALLSDHAGFEAMLEFANSRPPPVIEPLLKPLGDELWILYPGDPEHPIRERALPGPTRRRFRARK